MAVKTKQESKSKKKQESKVEQKKLVNNTCPKCSGDFDGESFEVISDRQVTQDVTCNGCGYIFRHYYTLTDVEEI